MSDKEEIVLEALKKAGKPLRTGEIVKLVDLSKNEVSKVIKELKKKGKIHSPKRCFYAPI